MLTISYQMTRHGLNKVWIIEVKDAPKAIIKS